jgi:hypothetical protein
MNSKLTMGMLIVLYLGITVFSVATLHARSHAGLAVSALPVSR